MGFPTLYEGDRRDVPFDLIHQGTSDKWDVSSAESIRLEFWSTKGVYGGAVEADSGHADADWSKGRVVFTPSAADLTEHHGTYRCVITLTFGENIVTVPNEPMTVEVLEKPAP